MPRNLQEKISLTEAKIAEITAILEHLKPREEKEPKIKELEKWMILVIKDLVKKYKIKAQEKPISNDQLQKYLKKGLLSKILRKEWKTQMVLLESFTEVKPDMLQEREAVQVQPQVDPQVYPISEDSKETGLYFDESLQRAARQEELAKDGDALSKAKEDLLNTRIALYQAEEKVKALQEWAELAKKIQDDTNAIVDQPQEISQISADSKETGLSPEERLQRAERQAKQAIAALSKAKQDLLNTRTALLLVEEEVNAFKKIQDDLAKKYFDFLENKSNTEQEIKQHTLPLSSVLDVKNDEKKSVESKPVLSKKDRETLRRILFFESVRQGVDGDINRKVIEAAEELKASGLEDSKAVEEAIKAGQIRQDEAYARELENIQRTAQAARIPLSDAEVLQQAQLGNSSTLFKPKQFAESDSFKSVLCPPGGPRVG